MGKKARSWSGRFNASLCARWRVLQSELRESGPSDRAAEMEAGIRAELGGDVIPRQLHYAAFPTRSKRPGMLTTWDAAPPRQIADVKPAPVAAALRPGPALDLPRAVRRSPPSKPVPSKELLDLYREWQDALERWGPGPVAFDLYLELCKLIEPNAELEHEAFDACLEELHRQAYPNCF